MVRALKMHSHNMAGRWYFAMIAFLIVLGSCKRDTTDQVENRLMECLVARFSAEGVDLIAALDRYERYLLVNHFLGSMSGQGYYGLFKEISETNKINSVIDDDEFPEFFSIPEDEIFRSECYQRVRASSAFAHSRTSQMEKAFALVDPGSRRSLANAAGVWISVLGPEDFEHPYFRAKSLLTIAYISDTDHGLLPISPHTAP